MNTQLFDEIPANYLPLQQASHTFGIDVSTLYRWRKNNKIRDIKNECSGRVWVNAADIHKNKSSYVLR